VLGSIWQNGFLMASKFATPFMGTGSVNIGNCPAIQATNTGQVSHIQIDDLYIYNRAQSPAEIYSHHVYNSPGSHVGLMIWLAFDDAVDQISQWQHMESNQRAVQGR
jgi:hypothetical protein